MVCPECLNETLDVCRCDVCHADIEDDGLVLESAYAPWDQEDDGEAV